MWVCKDPINFPGCQEIVNQNQATMAAGYGLQPFQTQQDCIDATECPGKEKPGGKPKNDAMVKPRMKKKLKEEFTRMRTLWDYKI